MWKDYNADLLWYVGGVLVCLIAWDIYKMKGIKGLVSKIYKYVLLAVIGVGLSIVVQKDVAQGIVLAFLILVIAAILKFPGLTTFIDVIKRKIKG